MTEPKCRHGAHEDKCPCCNPVNFAGHPDDEAYEDDQEDSSEEE